jgi:hypothetical protein
MTSPYIFKIALALTGLLFIAGFIATNNAYPTEGADPALTFHQRAAYPEKLETFYGPAR